VAEAARPDNAVVALLKDARVRRYGGSAALLLPLLVPTVLMTAALNWISDNAPGTAQTSLVRAEHSPQPRASSG
jgi:hypothetical protein